MQIYPCKNESFVRTNSVIKDKCRTILEVITIRKILMIFVLKSPLNAEIVYYNFNFAFNYKNANQPPDIKDEFYRVICQTKSA